MDNNFFFFTIASSSLVFLASLIFSMFVFSSYTFVSLFIYDPAKKCNVILLPTPIQYILMINIHLYLQLI